MDYRITFIIPNIPVVESVKSALEKIGLDYPVYLRSTGEAVELARELIPRGVKLIVSHGLTLENIRKELAIPASPSAVWTRWPPPELLCSCPAGSCILAPSLCTITSSAA